MYNPKCKTMKKLLLFVSVFCCFTHVFSQKTELMHSLDISTGYAYRGGHSGVGMQFQYGLGVIPHLDILFSLSSQTGFALKTDKDGWHYDYTIGTTDNLDRFYSCLSYTHKSLAIGARTYLDFSKICTARLSVLYGISANSYYNSQFNLDEIPRLPEYNLVMTAEFMFKTKGEILFQASQNLKLGVFYDFTTLFFKDKFIYNKPIHTTGFVIDVKIK